MPVTGSLIFGAESSTPARRNEWFFKCDAGLNFTGNFGAFVSWLIVIFRQGASVSASCSTSKSQATAATPSSAKVLSGSVKHATSLCSVTKAPDWTRSDNERGTIANTASE